MRASNERRHVSALHELRPDPIVSADQAARKRRAAETVLLSDVGCGVRRFSRGHQASRPGGRQAADSIVARDQVCQLLASARPWRPKAAARRGGAAVEYSLRSALQSAAANVRLTYLRFPTCRSESGTGAAQTSTPTAHLDREHIVLASQPRSCLTRAKACVRTRSAHQQISVDMRTKRRESAAQRKPSC